MGLWDGTCMLSRLPISGGDRIRAVLLVETNEEPEINAGGFCDADDLWTPAFPPVPCEYDGQGGVTKLPRGQWGRLLRATFRGRGTIHESAWLARPVDIDTCSAATVFKLAERGALRIRGVRVRRVGGVEKRFKKTRRVGLALVRAAVYEQLLDVGAREGLHAQADAYVQWLSRQRKAPAAEAKAPQPELLRALQAMGTRSVHPFQALHRALSSQRRSGPSERDSTTLEVVRAAADVVLLNSLFADGRLHWGPVSGKGSQDAETFVQRALARATLAEIETIDAEDVQLRS